ncbi:MAG TPA: phosphoribosylamine--glycine ligase [Candidatus Dormibacteraeota bacterium]
MRILIVGGGGREHALAWWCRRDRDDVELIVAPGNGGTAAIAENVPVDVTDAEAVARLARERAVDLVVIGPDAAAAAGVADACGRNGTAVFGPTAAAARIESSKTFAKRLMDGAGIPTARWVSGSMADRGGLRGFIGELGGRCVVKADGLALGKGVTVCAGVDEAERALDACVRELRFGDAGRTVVIEERLSGEELSVFGISDGRRVRVLPSARDHKRAGDGDTGPNTGGMGAVSPVPGVAEEIVDTIATSVLETCVDALRENGTPFVGCLYAGLMLTSDGVRVLEFNARFGDPEAQVLLPLVEEDGVGLLGEAARGTVTPGHVRTAYASAAGVVAAAAGYPATARTGDEITGLADTDRGVLVFHAGTRLDAGGTLRTTGGRVLCVVATAATLEAARVTAYENLRRVHFEGMQYRRDIGLAGGTPPVHPPDQVALSGGTAE